MERGIAVVLISLSGDGYLPSIMSTIMLKHDSGIFRERPFAKKCWRGEAISSSVAVLCPCG